MQPMVDYLAVGRATLGAATRSADMQKRGPDMKEGKMDPSKEKTTEKQQKHIRTHMQVKTQAGKEKQGSKTQGKWMKQANSKEKNKESKDDKSKQGETQETPGREER